MWILVLLPPLYSRTLAFPYQVVRRTGYVHKHLGQCQAFWCLTAGITTNEFASLEPLPCLPTKPPPRMCPKGDRVFTSELDFSIKITTFCTALRAGLEFSPAWKAWGKWVLLAMARAVKLAVFPDTGSHCPVAGAQHHQLPWALERDGPSQVSLFMQRPYASTWPLKIFIFNLLHS